jgi:hypothetical protein
LKGQYREFMNSGELHLSGISHKERLFGQAGKKEQERGVIEGAFAHSKLTDIVYPSIKMMEERGDTTRVTDPVQISADNPTGV